MPSQREELLDLKEGQSFKTYQIISKVDNPSGQFAIPLGEGGSGIVYLAEQTFIGSIKVKRAIKFFVFRDDIAKDHETSGRISIQNFNDEILNISSFNHENIIKIIDGGIEQRNGDQIPYIVTDYVEGTSLDKFLSTPALIDEYVQDGHDIIDIFGQICNGIKYLHSKSFFHCDIAPKNIFIKGEKGNFQIVVGDLGVGKTLTASPKSSNKLFVLGSRRYMPQNVLELLNKEIEQKEFLKLQPKWDLHSLKESFKQLLEIFEKKVQPDSIWFKSLKKIVTKDFEKISDVAKNIERLKPIYRQTAGIPELSEADSTLHGHYELHPIKSVWVTDRVKKIIRHPLYFRLKKVPQLLSSNTFNPGSNHTRYEHSLGTYENMRKVLVSLLRNEDFLELLDDKNIELALVASLLSSISKFPFSFIIHEIRDKDEDYYNKFNSKSLIEGILNFKEPTKGIDFSLWEIIQKEFGLSSQETLIEIIKGITDWKWSKDTKIISKLLNSSIDMRVLDFLPRDSYHLGISSGAHIDFDSLIANICIHDGSFAVRSRGVTYIEQVVTLRYWLYKRIYWNSPNRAYTSVLKYIFTKLYLETPSFEDALLKECIFADTNDMLYFLDKNTKQSELNGDKFLPLNRLLKTIYSDRPVIFKEIFVVNQTESLDELNQICNTYSKLPFLKLEELRKELENELSSVLEINPDEINILIDIPNEDNKKLGEDLTIIKHDNQPMQLKRLSGLINGISTTFDDNLKFLRVYLNPIYKEQLKKPKKRDEIHHVIQNFLKEHS